MAKKSPETASQMLDALYEALVDPRPDFTGTPPSDLNKYLEERRLDPGRVRKRAKSTIAAYRSQLQLAKAREARRALKERFTELQASAAVGLRESLLGQIKALAGQEQAKVYARKFDHAPDEDLASLVDDFDLLDKLDFGDYEPPE